MLNFVTQTASLLYKPTVWFHFQEDCAPAHTAKLAQDGIATNCSELIDILALILLAVTSGELRLNTTR